MSGGPIKRSSVHHVHAQQHAKFVEQHGWEIAASFGDAERERTAAVDGVALADVSWFGKLECKGPWAASTAGEPIGGAIACPVTPERAIWVVEPLFVDRARATLEALRASQPACYLLDVSSVYGSFELVGPRFGDVFCKISSARIENGRPIFAPAAGVRCLLIRTDRGLQLHFQREFGQYLWETLLDAGKEFEIRPVGVEALEMASVSGAEVV